jgi:hypothetical protein
MAVMAILVGCSVSSVLSMGKPTLPVVIHYRHSVVGQGKVAIFSNQSSNRLTLTVKVEDRTRSQKSRGQWTLLQMVRPRWDGWRDGGLNLVM